jgi:hypothetical protein
MMAQQCLQPVDVANPSQFDNFVMLWHRITLPLPARRVG